MYKPILQLVHKCDEKYLSAMWGRLKWFPPEIYSLPLQLWIHAQEHAHGILDWSGGAQCSDGRSPSEASSPHIPRPIRLQRLSYV